MKRLVKMSQKFLAQGRLPDPVIRFGIRELLKNTLKDEAAKGIEFAQARFIKFLHQLQSGPIALHTQTVNEQHYEVPTEFFQLVLGKHLKYSSGYWRPGVRILDQAESDMLEITTERADLSNGQTILELGCGWGSLALFMARKYPQSRIVAVSNSRTQKEYIDAQAAQGGLRNIEIITADMNTFQSHEKFDRVVSVEMFEHMRNWAELLHRIAGWLKNDGRLFIHIFTHKEYAYSYDKENESDWIGKYFFTGGIMPSDDLLLYFQDHFSIENHWRVSGEHYQKTAQAWLKNMDAKKEKILPILRSTYGEKEYRKWWVFWRTFFMSCDELWGYDNGEQWLVSHYLLKKR